MTEKKETSFKSIMIGDFIRERVKELQIEMPRICKFLDVTDSEVEEMYLSKDISTDRLMRWSKLLDYDFFRIFSQHLIMYSPPSNIQLSNQSVSHLPKFRKNIYTKEIIEFVLDMLDKKEKTIKQIVDEYNIPRVTIYTWKKKYSNL